MIMDRRAFPRRPVSVLGHVLTRTRSVFCRVLDLSDRGARLGSAKAETIPDQFHLHVPSEGLSRTSAVRWRMGGQIGVKFDEPA
jgi:hypothetical protein